VEVQTFDIFGPLLLLPKKHLDARGFFAEVYRQDVLASKTGPIEFVQDNQSRSSKAGTVRGLHFQVAPTPQAKLVRVVHGAIFDVAVDIRQSSPTYGHHVTATLSVENLAQLYVPIGFAHGFCTLEPNTEVVYKVSSYYDPATEKGLLWNDPALKIEWPLGLSRVTISDKDRNYPPLAQLGTWFT
jgi:dTDP-4-dehydrorhamnose 3,5-epimerase